MFKGKFSEYFNLSQDLSGCDPVHACLLSCFSHVWLFEILRTVACQAPLSMGLSWQEYWRRITISSTRGCSQFRDWTCLSCVYCIGRQILYHWATWEARLWPHLFLIFLLIGLFCFVQPLLLICLLSYGENWLWSLRTSRFAFFLSLSVLSWAASFLFVMLMSVPLAEHCIQCNSSFISSFILSGIGK